jgi:hypothetical protein
METEGDKKKKVWLLVSLIIKDHTLDFIWLQDAMKK